MNNKVFITIFALVLILISCEKNDDVSLNERGILKGTIRLYEGNCMPINTCKPLPVSTNVAITKPSENFNMDLLIDSTLSSSNGTYMLHLPEGEYSLFLRDGNSFICDIKTCPDDCYCTLFTISKDSVTTVNAEIDHATW